MNQIRIFVLLVLSGITLSAQKNQVDALQAKTLFYIDKEPITVSEFRYIYEKNNRDQADYSKQSIEEYLDLYINFKLKVHKARSMKYHESEAYQKELEGYRSQLVDSYVIDREVVSRMVDEIYTRQQEDIELRHILVSAGRKISDKAEIEALDKITLIKKSLDQGMEFEKAVINFSQDQNSASQGGEIGFVNAPLPDGYVALEDAAYSLQVGAISDPVRTDLGYHIIQVVRKRPARGVMEGQHLLIRKERNGFRLAGVKPKIDKIYKNILNGSTTFEQATMVSSEDKDTKGNGGNLGFFGIGQYERSFEDAAFGIKEDGAISAPVETSIGWHIIRRVGKRSSDDKKAIMERLKNKPKKGERFDRITQEVVAEIKQEAHFKEDMDLLSKLKQELAEDFFDYNWKLPVYDQQQLLSYGTDVYNLNDFAAFAKKMNKERMRAKGRSSISNTVDGIYQAFVTAKAISYAEDRLEERYIDFKNLMREYREGILLFDVTKDFVWDKASSDTSKISHFFEKHKLDYQWKDRADITQYTITSIEPHEITKILNASRSKSPKELCADFNQEKEIILYKQETLERGSKLLKGMTLTKGYISAPVFKNNLKVATFKKIENVIPARQKTLKEARGYVISDYQDQLDKEWIMSLKDEYKIKIQKKILKKLIR